jgi:hypothetical protein
MSLKTSKGRSDIQNSAYYRLFAETTEDEFALQLASIMSKIHARTISNGCMLDSTLLVNPIYNSNEIMKKTTSSTFNVDDPNRHYSKFKLLKRDCAGIDGKNAIEIDYMTITCDEVCIYEIKDGDNFDTKKSKGEIDSLKLIQQYFSGLFPDKTVSYHLVLWNANDISKTSFKVTGICDDVLMTGHQFAIRIGCDFEGLSIARTAFALENKQWVRSALNDLLSSF